MSAATGTLLMGLTFTSTANAGGVLKAAVADWTGGAVTCEIIHQVLTRSSAS